MSYMKCDLCGDEATNRFVVDEVSSHVCDGCMKGRSNIAKVQAVFAILDSALPEVTMEVEQKYPDKCGGCGLSLRQMVNSMRCGCPECYVTYSRIYDEIDRETAPFGTDDEDGLTRLVIDLEAAIREERYEDAKDIKTLMEKIK